MQKSRKNKGFTLAELLIVVAIIIILGSIVTVNVVQYQRSMALLERDSIAREIFVASQNHLAMAESQGYLGLEEKEKQDNKHRFGTEEVGEDGKNTGVYYFVVEKGRIVNPDVHVSFEDSVLGLMLPPGSIEESIRLHGNYVIRYHKDSAQIMDVFYWSTDTTPRQFMIPADYNYSSLDTQGDYSKWVKDLVAKYGADSKRKDRENYQGTGSVIGWYGGVTVEVANSVKLKAPQIIVHNEEILWVEIINPNSTPYYAELTLWVKGLSSVGIKSITLEKGNSLSSNVTYILDDITTNTDIATPKSHFCNNSYLSGLVPGENINVQVQLAVYPQYVSDEDKGPMNTVFSNIETTNSLFGDGSTPSIDGDNKLKGTVEIKYFRHLENLSQAVSGIQGNNSLRAEQNTDLDWNDFENQIKRLRTKLYITRGLLSSDSIDIYGADGSTTLAEQKDDVVYYYPVSPNYALTYDGKTHSIYNVTVNTTGDAGLFGNPTGTLTVSDLQLVDFNITGTTSAGALAGKLTNSSVTNVLARNSKEKDSTFNNTSPNVTATGSAGGLVGSMTGGSIERSATALIVSGSGNAGGLIGSAGDDTMIIACYSGGHTKDGAYKTVSDAEDYTKNVVGTTTAGGLVGAWSSTGTISKSYSTCSATGTTAGGLVGSATAGTINNCYATGLVSGATAGAFIGSSSLGAGAITDSHYFSIINGIDPVRGKETVSGLSALDASTAAYESFVGAPTGKPWKPASAYDSKLIQYYQGKYNLKTVEQLDGTNWDENSEKKISFVRTHYGDWPAPEVFVPNT